MATSPCAGEGLPMLPRCSALLVVEQGEFFNVPTPTVTRDLGFYCLIRQTGMANCGVVLLAILSRKRTDYLEWTDYFMAIAFLSAQRSKDPRTQVGACIVNKENKIVGIGYNGMPMGCHDDKMPWGREAENILDTKQLYVCHAELNAVLNKNSADVKDCSIYVALFPCNECAKVVIQSGIKEVIYYSDKYKDKPEFIASRRMMDLAGVKYRQHQPKQKQITIDFSVIENATNTTT